MRYLLLLSLLMVGCNKPAPRFKIGTCVRNNGDTEIVMITGLGDYSYSIKVLNGVNKSRVGALSYDYDADNSLHALDCSFLLKGSTK